MKTQRDNAKTDKELRRKIRLEGSGARAIVICRTCENFISSPDGNTATCRIVNACPKCACREWLEVIEESDFAISVCSL